MNSKMMTYKDVFYGVYRCVVQPVQMRCTTSTDALYNRYKASVLLKTMLLSLLLLVLGGGNVWAQTPPVEITTDEDEINHTEKLYLIQTNQFQSFYMIPNGTNVSTANLPNEQMLWYFKDAGGEDNDGNQYYYIVNKNKKYICHGGGTSNTDASRGITLVEKTSSNEGRCKFKLIEIGTEGFYNIRTITDQKYYALNKRSGSVSSQYPIRLTDSQYASDLNSKWKFIRFNGIFTWPDPPFTPSTDTEKHYYKINSKISTNYYISTNTDNKVTFASTQSDNMVWYFKEVPSNLAGESSSWFKYYYIVNQNSDDQYMYYDGTATDGTTQSDVVSLKEKSEGIEDRYQFIIVQTAKTTTNDAPVECYMIVPKLLREVLWDYNSIGPDAVSDGSVIDIIKGRVNDDTKDNYAHVTFASIDQCAEPTISLDPSTNKVVISSTESGSSIYYTISDGIVNAETLPFPTRTDNPYSSPIPPSTVTIKAVTVKNNYSIAKSNPVTKTIVYMPTITLEDVPWIYDKTAKEPSISSVMVGETSIPSTDYDITYTENINAGTASVTIRNKSNSGYLIYGTTNFTISQAPLTVTAKSKSITYGDAPANNGVEYSGFADTDDESVLVGGLVYAYDYAQNGDVGEYTITPSGLSSSNYDISFVGGTLTVDQKEVELVWSETTTFPYDGNSHAPTATAANLVNGDVIEITVTGAQSSVGSYTATATALTGDKKDNYKLPEANTQTFTISRRSIGDGINAAEGIDIQMEQVGEEVEVTSVKDGETTLVVDEDYTVAIEEQGDDWIIIVSGIGNYEGSARGLFVHAEFYKAAGADKAVAAYRSPKDFSKPSGIDIYIVRKVNPSIGTVIVSSIDYLPKDVPVLLERNDAVTGFLVSEKPAEDPEITAETKNSNLLHESYKGLEVDAAQIYMMYRGEFVLTKAGTFTEGGKFYLYNPNFKAEPEPDEPSGGESRGILQIIIEEWDDHEGTTEMIELKDSRIEQWKSDVWYTLDGRHLSGEPTKGGIYIHKGQKVIIKRK